MTKQKELTKAEDMILSQWRYVMDERECREEWRMTSFELLGAASYAERTGNAKAAELLRSASIQARARAMIFAEVA